MIKPSPTFLGNFIQGTEWTEFTGDYEKQFCDVRTRDGREFGPCWPNGTLFHCVNHIDPNVKPAEVTHVRYYRDNTEGVQP